MKRSATSAFYPFNNSNNNNNINNIEDRLSSLPDVLLLYIFSFLDTKLAVQSSTLSKRWVHLWTILPTLNFDRTHFRTITLFDNFIDKVLARRNGLISIDTVSIKVSDYKTMVRVFNYAVSHRVVNLSVDCSEWLTYYRDVKCSDNSDSLVRLTLRGMLCFGGFGRFSGLVKLRLDRVKIVETEAFSCFPNLEELCLVNSKLRSDLGAVEVVGPKLSRLRVFSCFSYPVPYGKIVVSAPGLRVLELDGLIPMTFECSLKLSVLERVYIDCFIWICPVDEENRYEAPDEEQQRVNLIKILRCCGNAEVVHLSPSTVEILSKSHGKLVQESCPFVNLKVLNLIPPPNKPAPELHSDVSTYLLKGSPGVVVKALPR